MSETIRVLVAEDSPTVRRYLTKLIEETPEMQVVGEARDGEEAVRLVSELRPDVVSMDIKMPLMDGLDATRRIMQVAPTPVVVVSSLLEEDIELSLMALQAGALAVVGKPPDRHHQTFEARREQLIKTLKAMADVRVISRRPQRNIGDVAEVPAVIVPAARQQAEVLVIGASTGGPSALHRLVRSFPQEFDLPIAIVQHMPNEFINGLARWLSSVTRLAVHVASDGLRLSRGMIVIAPGTHHMTLIRRGDGLAIRLIEDAGGHRYQPSVDVLFESAAVTCGTSAIGVILTGMGDDGARGLLAMRQAGAHTLAQDESTSTVFGMPNAAILCGAVEQVQPLPNLATEIVKLI